jgi:potassium-dependent mechanosensitive channel
LNKDHGSDGKLADKPISIRDLLLTIPLFKDLNELQMRRLIEIGDRQHIEEQQILFNEGDPGDAFYIILSGSVEVFLAKLDKHLATLKAGAFFGEVALMLNIPRTASIQTLEDTILFSLNRSKFEQFLQEYPEVAELIIQELGSHQQELANRHEELRQKGLMTPEEDDLDLVKWVRKRFQNLFFNQQAI